MNISPAARITIKLLGILSGVTILAASTYSVLTILDFLPMDWKIFFTWLFLLVAVNVVWLWVFWVNRRGFSMNRQVGMILWGAVSVWYWAFAPIYFSINSGIDLVQLRWSAFEYFWEVPIFGLLFIFTCLIIFRPIAKFIDDNKTPNDPRALYKNTLDFPVRVSYLIIIFTFAGYIAGTWQSAVFAAIPFWEQVKLLITGAMIALFLSVFLYLFLDYFLERVRNKIEEQFTLKNLSTRHIYTKVSAISILTALGSMALVSLFVLNSFQLIVRENVLTILEEDVKRVSSNLTGVRNQEERIRLIEELKRGPNAKAFILNPSESVPVAELALETRRAIFEQESGIIDDVYESVKLVAFFEDPQSSQKIVSITYLSDFYGSFVKELIPLTSSILLILVVAVIAANVLSLLITKPLKTLIPSIKSAIAPPHEFKGHVSTADEFEELSHSFEFFINKANKANEALSEEKARLLAVIENLSIGLAFFNKEKTLIIKNQSFNQIFRDNIVDISDLSSLLSNTEFDTAYKKSIKKGEVVELKNISLGKKFLRILIHPITENKEEKIGSVLLFEDITEAKLLEETREGFFTTASHEMRTPLTLIRGNLAMIKKRFPEELKENKDLEKMVTSAHWASVNLVRMVSDFLNIATLEHGKVAFNKENIDLVDLCENVIKELEPLAKDKNLYIKLEKPKDRMPKAIADRGKVRQILFNLLNNAIHFTSEGGITISLEKEENNIKIIVEDTGIGIPVEIQETLFKRFSHSKEELLTKDTSGGAGLGLYISQLLAKGMGGELSLAKSEVGGGSAFTLRLPTAW